jgi:hypothetical protein
MQRFVIERNIANYVDHLQGDSLSPGNEVIRRLLIEEEDRFGLCTEQLENVQRWISECERRVLAINALPAGRAKSPVDADLRVRTLSNLRDLLQLFRERQAWLQKKLDKGAI